MLYKQLKYEYTGANAIRECLQKHAAFCMYCNFDQIRKTDMIPVQCCECNETFRVPYSKVALELFCSKHTNTEVSKEHLAKLQKRLLDIKRKLL